MEYSSNFKVLNIQEIARRNSEELKEEDKTFLKLNLLDFNNNPCSFMIFGKDKNKVLELDLKSLEDVVITFGVNYNKDRWNVNFIDIDIR